MNIFDVNNAPTTEPETFTVGDFGQWKRPDISANYPPLEYNLTYIARLTSGGSSEIKVEATDLDGVHLFTVTSADSSSYNAGLYHWQLEVEQISSGNRVVIQNGDVEVVVDLDENNTDPRSHAQIMIQKINGLLEGKADSDVSSYSIAGRSISKMSFQELIDARDYYSRELIREKNKVAIKNGKGSSSTIKVRF
jgi:hypothetical protein